MKQPINPADHHCQFAWCTGTMWAESHLDIEVVDTAINLLRAADAIEVAQ